MCHEQDYAHAEEAAHGRGTTHPPPDGSRGAPRRWPDQPGDRPGLFISERTAESHVEQTRNKLGFHSRTQIAVWFAETKAQLVPPGGPGVSIPGSGPAGGRTGRGHVWEDSQNCLDADGRGELAARNGPNWSQRGNWPTARPAS